MMMDTTASPNIYPTDTAIANVPGNTISSFGLYATAINIQNFLATAGYNTIGQGGSISSQYNVPANQWSIAIASYCALGNTMNSSFASNLYTLSPKTNNTGQSAALPYALPTILQSDIMFKFVATNNNTGNSQISITGLMSSPLPLMQTVFNNNVLSYAQLVANSIIAGQLITVRWHPTANAGNPAFVIDTIPTPAPLSTATAGTDNIKYITSNVLQQILQPINGGGVPYSITSAYRLNGYAGFINPTPIDNATIGFLVDIGTTYGLIVARFPDLSFQALSTLPNVTGLTNNGLYNIVLEKGQTIAFATINTITESIIAPSSPTNGDYWLDISVYPYLPYKRISGAWVLTQYVKLGQVTKSGGVMGSPISYNLNRKCLNYIGSLTGSIAHNLGTDKIKISRCVLRCVLPTTNCTVGASYNYVLRDSVNLIEFAPFKKIDNINIFNSIFGLSNYNSLITNDAGSYTVATAPNFQLEADIESNF